MSGNAALAAAKRRRNPVEKPEPKLNASTSNQSLTGGSDLKTNRDRGAQLHPLQVVLEHDRQLFEIERRLENLNMDVLSENAIEMTNELDSLVKNNSSELRLLKATVQKQQKSIQELTSVITSLKATLSNHETTINELCQDMSGVVEKTDVSTETEEDTGSTVKLDVSEK